MAKRSFGKQAISPLVATVLLLAFSIALGAVVMSWGEEYVSQKADFVQGIKEVLTSCEAVSFNIVKIANIPQACYKANKIQLMIDNGPDTEIQDFNARIASTNGIQTVESILNAPLQKIHAVKLAIPFQTDILTPQQLKLVPKIKINNDIVYCKDQNIIIEGIQKCQ